MSTDKRRFGIIEVRFRAGPPAIYELTIGGQLSGRRGVVRKTAGMVRRGRQRPLPRPLRAHPWPGHRPTHRPRPRQGHDPRRPHADARGSRAPTAGTARRAGRPPLTEQDDVFQHALADRRPTRR